MAVIGAGPSGLAVLRAFQSAKEAGDDIPHLVCFEKQDNWGGLWNYTWRTGLDVHGEPVHGSMYRHMWSNGPKECLEFTDYTFEEHFGKAISSFPPREVLADYIIGRVERTAEVKDWIRFEHPVRWVEHNVDTDQFTVIAHDLVKDTQVKEEFDYVIVATGHFSTPDMPYFQGLDKFDGRVLHSHDFRNALEFKDRDVMVIGASFSAEDIGSQCWKYGARSVTACYRNKPMPFQWPGNWDTKPLLDHVDGKTCYFIDGTSKDLDAIIFCTGYLHYFPFIEDDIRLITTNRLWTPGLYRGVAFEKNPKIMYIGMQDQFFTFNRFDAQAWWARDVIMGRLTLPSRADMEEESGKWEERERNTALEDEIWFEKDYLEQLIEMTDYPPLNMEGCIKSFFQFEDHKRQNIMSYRDIGYRSLITGTMSPVHHTKWEEAMDDSMEEYLKN